MTTTTHDLEQIAHNAASKWYGGEKHITGALTDLILTALQEATAPYQKRVKTAELLAKDLRTALDAELREWAETDTAVRNALKPFTDVAGDKYDVPSIRDLVEQAAKKLTALKAQCATMREALRKSHKLIDCAIFNDQFDVDGEEARQFLERVIEPALKLTAGTALLAERQQDKQRIEYLEDQCSAYHTEGNRALAERNALKEERDRLREDLAAEKSSGSPIVEVLKYVAREVAAHGDCHCTEHDSSCVYCAAVNLSKVGALKLTDAHVENDALMDVKDMASDAALNGGQPT